MSTRFLTVLLGLGLALSMFTWALGNASANQTGTQEAYFPWVPNGANLTGLDNEVTGPWHGTITVQNIEDVEIEVDFYVGIPGSGYQLQQTETVAAHASTTMSAAQLAAGSDEDGFAVRAVGYIQRGNDNGDDGHNNNEIRAHITGAAKNMSPNPSEDGKTDGSHIAVDGYSAHTENHVGGGYHILPIVQTNSGWNTDIKIANWGGSSESVTVTFYDAFGDGQSGDSSGSFDLSLDAGEVGSVNLDLLEHAGELNLGSEFVGSAWVSVPSDASVSAIAERVKPNDDMLVTNTSRPEGEGNSTKYAPLVFQNYNMWNTGISVANLSDSTNTVTIDFYGPANSGQISETLQIAPRSMEFLYIPGVQQLGLDEEGFVGSAIIHSESGDPFHASVDQVKYFGSGIDVGSAMSYITEHDTAGNNDPETSDGDGLALPIYQKGNAVGNSDTSGIQLFNVSPDNPVNAHIWFYDKSGARAEPTLEIPRTVSLEPRESRTVYALDLPAMPDGFNGSAMVHTSGEGELVAVSNNVNYDVGGDGSAAYNLIRVPGEPQEPTPSEVEIDPVSETSIWGDWHEIIVRVSDQFGNPMDDVDVDYGITEGPHRGYHRDDFSFFGSTADGEFIIEYQGDQPRHGLKQDTISIEVDGVHGVFTAIKSWEFGEPANIDLKHVEEFEGEIPASVIVYDEHQVVATVTDANGNELKGVEVEFDVDNSQDDHSGSDITDAAGQAFVSYSSENTTPETPHTIVASVPGFDVEPASVQKNWVDFEISLEHFEAYDPENPNITVETEHEVVASLTRVDTGSGIDGAEIGFYVGGEQVQTGTTDVDGNVSFIYTAEDAGTDELTATALLANRTSNVIEKEWIDQ